MNSENKFSIRKTREIKSKGILITLINKIFLKGLTDMIKYIFFNSKNLKVQSLSRDMRAQGNYDRATCEQNQKRNERTKLNCNISGTKLKPAPQNRIILQKIQ